MEDFANTVGEISEDAGQGYCITKVADAVGEIDTTYHVARQKRLRVGDEWYRIDLLLFHRRLKCLVIVDLKIGKFTHADAGQMNLYLNCAREHWTHPSENPPVGLILCSKGDVAVAHYALGNLRNKVLAAEYKLVLPAEKQFVEELERTRKALDAIYGQRED